MKLIWSRNNKIGSKLIRWGLKSESSHFAVAFQENTRHGIVFHSYFGGAQIKWLNSFLRENEIVYSLDVHGTLEMEEEAYVNIINEYDGRSYDYWAFLYFFWRGLLFRLFGIPLPKRNLFQRGQAFLCVGIFAVLPEWVRGGVAFEDYEMKSPDELYYALKGART